MSKCLEEFKRQYGEDFDPDHSPVASVWQAAWNAAEAAVRAELAGQEPVAWMDNRGSVRLFSAIKHCASDVPLFAAPVVQPDDLKDAERYRWLRDKSQPQNRNGPGLYWYLPRFMQGTKEEQLDAAIDNAMKELK